MLNDSALQIAKHLLDGADAETTANWLVAEYSVGAQTARADVERVEQQLEHEGFIGPRSQQPLERAPALRSLFLHLTSRCNLRCGHCYATGGTAEPEDLSAHRAIALIDESLAAGAQAIALSGGEPLCHPQIEAILKHAAARAQVQLLTNGTLIDAAWADRLAALGVGVSISLDGSRPELHDRLRGPGSYQGALRAIQLLQHAGVGARLNINTTVTADNIDDLDQLVALAEERGLPLIRFLPLRQVGRAGGPRASVSAPTDTEYEAFFQRATRWQQQGALHVEVSCGLSGVVLKGPGPGGDELWCPLGRSLVVDCGGDAYPCVLLMHPAFRLGNVFEQDPQQLMRSAAMAEVCAALARRRQTIDACQGCLWRDLCQGGCMGQALEHAGTIWQTDRFCAYRQRAYAAAFHRVRALHAPDDAA